MNKLISLAGIILLIFSCQRVDTEKKSERVYIFNNSDSIKLQMETVEKSLLPAISAKGFENIKYNIYDRMKDYQVPAVSIAVIDNYKVIWAKAYGVTKTRTLDSISISTMFQAASLSKPITSIVTMHLSKKGVIDIDKAINSQMSNWKIPENNFTIGNSITPRMILLHTSGLNIPGFPGYNINDTIPRVIDILNGLETSKTEKIIPQFVPNTKWSYSGGGYIVLQMLLEERTGKGFQQLMQSNLFDPLNIRNSTFEQPLPTDKYKFVADGHLADNSIVEGNWRIYPELAAAGLWTTPFDLASILLDLQLSARSDSGKLLDQETTVNMLAKYWGDMGLGFLIRNEGENTAFTFNGGNVGYRCDFFAYLNKGKGAVIMTNSDNGQGLINEVYRSIAKQYRWTDFNQSVIEQIEISTEKLLKLQSDYISYWPNGEEYIFTLKVIDNNLFFVRQNKKYAIVPVNEKHFKVLDNGWSLNFSTNNDLEMDTVKCFLEFGNTIAIRKK